MNNNTERISRYLNGEMTRDEKDSFENELLIDEELKIETEIQKQIIDVAINTGIKKEFARSMNNMRKKSHAIRIGLAVAACLLALLVFNFGNVIFNGNKAVQNNLAEIVSPFVNPPMPEIDVPLTEYVFNAETGATLFHKTGSIITFPASALIDATGAPVTGNVKVTYREFKDPLDFFVSGIPMGYDSAGKQYNFESSGMCEIKVYKNDKPVFVNKNAQPEIHLATNNKDPQHNLYFLDTVNRKWNYLGKDVITEIKNVQRPDALSEQKTDELSTQAIKPVKPGKAEEDKQAFSIDILPGSFEELSEYDNLKFQVEDESNYRRSDAEEYWTNVKLNKTSVPGIYTVTFSNEKRTVTYKVRPVLEGKDYETALNVFTQKDSAYKQALRKRLTTENNIKDSMKASIQRRVDKEYQENKKINDLIEARNRFFRELRTKQQMLEQLENSNDTTPDGTVRLLDSLTRNVPDAKIIQENILNSMIVRSFAINNFGVWNCDLPVLRNNEIPITAEFLDDELNEKIVFTSQAVVCKEFNGITRYPSGRIGIMRGCESMIWAIKDLHFYYFTYSDFKQASITESTKAYTFTMRKSKQPVTSYDQIRKLAGNL